MYLKLRFFFVVSQQLHAARTSIEAKRDPFGMHHPEMQQPKIMFIRFFLSNPPNQIIFPFPTPKNQENLLWRERPNLKKRSWRSALTWVI